MTRELHDGYGRGINYLRISVTDKCNYRCVYCMPEEGVPARAHDTLLRAEAIARCARREASEGITLVRLKGGDPRGAQRIVPLVAELRAIPQIEDISLTTNGALLPSLAPALRAAGLDRVNISLDTLDAGRFAAITRRGRVEQALAGIDAALEHGFDPVKVNTVVVRRMEQDVLELAKLSLERPVHVRFIEYMPIGGGEDPVAGTAEARPSSPSAMNSAGPSSRPGSWPRACVSENGRSCNSYDKDKFRRAAAQRRAASADSCAVAWSRSASTMSSRTTSQSCATSGSLVPFTHSHQRARP